MKNFLIFIFSSVFSVLVSAHQLHLFAPGYQLRYEENNDQEIKYLSYKNITLLSTLNLNQSLHALGLEYNYKDSKSGNTSLNVSQKFKEYNLLYGYYFFTQTLDKEYDIYLDIGALAQLGMNNYKIITRMPPFEESHNSDNYLSLGMGVLAQLRISVFVLQTDFRYSYSKSYQPSYVPVLNFRLGFSINF